MIAHPTHVLRDPQGFGQSPEWARIENDIHGSIAAIKWPQGNTRFTVNPTRKGNGVVPVKEAFLTAIQRRGWTTEATGRTPFDFDAYRPLSYNGREFFFGVEWETGNVSSSHRSINRIGRARLEGDFFGGVLILPSDAMYPYFTDRIGNFGELEPYFQLWQTEHAWEYGFLAVISVEQDDEDPSVPLIKKGTDGRALI